jgi:hypothetical protein
MTTAYKNVCEFIFLESGPLVDREGDVRITLRWILQSYCEDGRWMKLAWDPYQWRVSVLTMMNLCDLNRSVGDGDSYWFRTEFLYVAN